MPEHHVPISRFLTDDGLISDGSNQLANVNGSVTPVPYYVGPPAGEWWAIYRMLIVMKDNGVPTADGYGAGAALTNGLGVDVKRNGVAGGVISDLTGGVPIKTRTDWAGVCYDVQDHTFGAGDNYAVARWTFAKAGRPILLSGDRNEVLVVTVKDNISILTGHTFHVQGHALAGHPNTHGLSWGGS